MKVLFVNENIGGHATTHAHLRTAVAERPDLTARFLDVPAPSILRRVAAVPVPVLSRLDLDLQPLRNQLATSAWTRTHLADHLAWAEIVHVYTHNAALLSARQLRRRPLVVALDGTNEMNAYRLPYRQPTRFTPWTLAATKAFERQVYDAADVLVANSETAAHSLRTRYDIAADRVRVIHYGIVAPVFASPAAPGTTAERPRLIFTGHAMERKGGNQLLRVHQRHFADRCDLVVITSESIAAATAVEVISDLRPGDQRLWELLRSSAVFVFPSLIDQQPNAIMEAMAAGLPVITHRINAMADMVEPDVNGFGLADASDAELATAIDRALDSAPTRQRLGAMSRARFDARFSAMTTVASLVEVFAEASRRHAGTAA